MKETIEKVIQENMALCFEHTEMVLDVICEQLYYHHGIDAKWKGRSIYIGEKRVASIEVSKEGYKCVAIWKYKML